MIRTFPRRKMVFCPSAKCKTVVPDTFAVLLSQRRRWIGSSIHNLFELAQVPNLCGVFCFSYQFLVIVELFGTLTLPIGIILTYALAINLILVPPTTFQQCIPVILLVSVLALPTLLIVATARKPSYVVWMLIYIAALPIWNFVLPIYALWHLDDLSWGDTRRVEGETTKQKVYSEDKTAVFDGTSVPLRRWADWEKSRLRNLRRSAQRKREMERMDQVKRVQQKTWQRAEAQSIVSDHSGDKWGSDIGGVSTTKGKDSLILNVLLCSTTNMRRSTRRRR
jgi:chitin synthase